MTNYFTRLLLLCVCVIYADSLQSAPVNDSDLLISQLEGADREEKLAIYKSLTDHYINTDPAIAITYATAGKTLAEEQDNKRYSADFLLRLGTANTARGNIDVALDQLLNSLKIYEELNFVPGIKAVYFSMSIFYEQTNDLIKAREVVDRAMKLPATEIPSESYARVRTASVYTTIGLAGKAIKFQKEAIRMATEKGDSLVLSELYCRLGAIYTVSGNYDSALHYLNTSLELKERVSDAESQFCTNIRMIEYYRIKKLPERAIDHGEKLLQLATTLGLRSYQVTIAQALAEDYFKAGSFEAAYEHKVRAAALKDSLLNEEKQRELASLETLYELDKKNSEIKAARLQKTFAVIATILCLAIVILLLARIRSQKKLNHIRREQLENSLALKNRELANANLYKTEKNRILTEIADDLEKLRRRPDLKPSDLRRVEKFVGGNIDRANEWEQLNRHFSEVAPGFFDKLKEQQPKLTQNELKHSAYLKMSLSNKEIARLLGINHSSVHMAQYRLKKKLELDVSQSLVSYLMAI